MVCDDSRQAIDNIYDFHKQLRDGDVVNIAWDKKSVTYNETVKNRQGFASQEPAEGRKVTIRYTQESGFIKVSADFLPFTVNDVNKQNCVMRYLMNQTADESNSLAYGIRDGVITIESAIFTDKDCSAYIKDFIQIRGKILSRFGEIPTILKDLKEFCS